MDTLSYKTKSLNAATIEKRWVLVDAQGQVLGRLASQIAAILRGKTKPGYTPHADCGDYVVVINADKVRLTGRKMVEKEYIWHTGYPGGQRNMSPREMMERKPTYVVEEAVRGMLPKNRLGREIFRNLHVYSGAEHKHAGQNPQPVELKY